jgi:hypothetical protein
MCWPVGETLNWGIDGTCQDLADVGEATAAFGHPGIQRGLNLGEIAG